MKKYSILLFCCLIYNITFSQKPKVLATASMISDMTKNIANNFVDVELIVPIGGDPHTYEPTPGDAKKVTNADLVLKNGLTFEGWINELIENSGTKADVVTVTDGIQPIKSDKYSNSVDPHAWMDATLGQKYIENIKNALVKLDPKNKAAYEVNYAKYKKELEATHQHIVDQMYKIPKEQRVLITSHDAFQYFGRKYEVQLEAILGTSTDAEVQTSDIMRLGKVIKEQKVPAVFVESTINPKLLQQLAKDNKVVVGGQLYADSIGDKDSPANSYLNMLRHNANTILAGLSINKKTKGFDKIAPLDDSHKMEENNSSNYILYGILGLLFIGGFFIAMKNMRK